MPYNFQLFKDESKRTESWLAKEFAQLHTGQATPALLDGVQVESYGAKVPISHTASVSIEDSKTLRISPWDKSQVKEIERAIMAANLGLSTAVDDNGIRVTFPPLTTERREQLAKIVHAKLENARIRVRADREKVWDDIQAQESAGTIPKDDKFRYKDELQKLVDGANAGLEELVRKKERELMG